MRKKNLWGRSAGVINFQRNSCSEAFISGRYYKSGRREEKRRKMEGPEKGGGGKEINKYEKNG